MRAQVVSLTACADCLTLPLSNAVKAHFNRNPTIMLSSSSPLARRVSSSGCSSSSSGGSRAAGVRTTVPPQLLHTTITSSSSVIAAAAGAGGLAAAAPSSRSRSSSSMATAAGNGATTAAVQPHAPQRLPLPEVSGPRVAVVKRATKETSVEVRINLDGTGRCVTNTPVGFLNHMLDQLASHGLFDVFVEAQGDTWIDDHHTVEDIALALGTAFSQALGDRKGIHRFGEFTAPLDEALTHVVLDLSGRAHLSCDLAIPAQRIGSFDTELVEHFFCSFATTSGTTLHIRQLAGRNSHHIVEATFKAFARALRRATESDPRRAGGVASSKGVLTQQ